MRSYSFLIAFTVALFLGLGSAWIVIERGYGLEKRVDGVWFSYPDRGAPDAGPYARAQLAIEGRLVPGRAEGIVYYAQADSSGRRLERTCSYRIEGRFPQARFWSLQAQGENGDTVAAVGMAAALQSQDVAFGTNGAIDIAVSTRIQPGNWLGIAGSGPMQLVLTLFDTPASASFGLNQSVMPEIERQTCAGEPT